MKMVLTAGVAALLLSSPSAFAQRDPDHGKQIQLTQYENRDRDRDRDQADRDRGHDQADRDREVRGTPHWARGDRLPEEFRSDRYAVADWRAMHLNRPARGYHWVHVGDRYLLVADRTGLIRDFRIVAELRH